MNVYVYTLSSPDDNQVMYVGISNCPSERYKGHLSEAKHQTSNPKNKWVRELLSQGKLPVMSVIDKCESGGRELEKTWISRLLKVNPDLLNVEHNRSKWYPKDTREKADTGIYKRSMKNLRRIYAETGENKMDILDRLVNAELQRVGLGTSDR